jgi:hypothetical protein
MSVIPKIPRASGGIAPLGPLPGFYPGPAWDLKRSPDPSPTHAPPLTTNHGSVPVYHLRLRVESTLFCNLQSRARTHAVLVIDLYELLSNPTTKLIEPPELILNMCKLNWHFASFRLVSFRIVVICSVSLCFVSHFTGIHSNKIIQWRIVLELEHK